MDKIVQLNNIFQLYNIGASCLNCKEYARLRTYDIKLKPNCRVKHLEQYLNEISIALQTPSLPTLRVLTEQGIVRLEYLLPNTSALNLFDLALQTTAIEAQMPCLLGETYYGAPAWLDMAQAPHMLVGGTTGSGKSTLLHTMVANFIPQNVMLHLMDTKQVEFMPYRQGFKNIAVSLEYDQCLDTLNQLENEMEQRYRASNKQHDVSHLIIIDEYADIVMRDENKAFQTTLCKLAQKSRAAGIHIVLATQRPSANIINGSIKANFPTRLSCKVASSMESRIILDNKGAEQLGGKGDAILKTNDCMRFQAAYTTPEEVCAYYQVNTLN